MTIKVHDRVQYGVMDDPWHQGEVYSITESKWLGKSVHVQLDGRGPTGERLYVDWLLEDVVKLEDENEEE